MARNPDTNEVVVDDAKNETLVVDEPTTTEPTVEPANVAPTVAEVAYFDGSTSTFDLHLADRRVAFVDGKAMVDGDTALILRDGGFIA